MACYFDHTIKWIKKAMDKNESVNVVVHYMCNIHKQEPKHYYCIFNGYIGHVAFIFTITH